MGGGGGFRDSEGTWLLGFHTFRDGGTALLAEAMALRDVLVMAVSRGWTNLCVTLIVRRSWLRWRISTVGANAGVSRDYRSSAWGADDGLALYSV